MIAERAKVKQVELQAKNQLSPQNDKAAVILLASKLGIGRLPRRHETSTTEISTPRVTIDSAVGLARTEAETVTLVNSMTSTGAIRTQNWALDADLRSVKQEGHGTGAGESRFLTSGAVPKASSVESKKEQARAGESDHFEEPNAARVPRIPPRRTQSRHSESKEASLPERPGRARDTM